MALRRILVSILPLALASAVVFSQTSTPTLSLEKQEEFLKTGKILSSRLIGRGVTKSSRATMSLGPLIHDVQMQAVNLQLNELYAPDGTPIPWRDDFRHNIAAYKLDRMLGMGLVPPSVERTVAGKRTAVTWWVDDVLMLESDRVSKSVEPPDPASWKRFLSTAALFDQLIFNVDRNTGNLVITKGWNLVLIDHTRAFAPNPRLLDRENFDQCKQSLWAALPKLTEESITAEVKTYLTPQQIKAILIRRDLVVKHFAKLISEKGEAAVLFP
jgi:hypothetical protein